MILYFNDYKLIYIITMMGKINNIPVLNEDVIRLVVLNEEIIGYIYPRRTSYVVALEIKPGRTTSLATSVNKQCMVLLSDKVRLATSFGHAETTSFRRLCHSPFICPAVCCLPICPSLLGL